MHAQNPHSCGRHPVTRREHTGFYCNALCTHKIELLIFPGCHFFEFGNLSRDPNIWCVRKHQTTTPNLLCSMWGQIARILRKRSFWRELVIAKLISFSLTLEFHATKVAGIRSGEFTYSLKDENNQRPSTIFCIIICGKLKQFHDFSADFNSVVNIRRARVPDWLVMGLINCLQKLIISHIEELGCDFSK